MSRVDLPREFTVKVTPQFEDPGYSVEIIGNGFRSMPPVEIEWGENLGHAIGTAIDKWLLDQFNRGWWDETGSKIIAGGQNL